MIRTWMPVLAVALAAVAGTPSPAAAQNKWWGPRADWAGPGWWGTPLVCSPGCNFVSPYNPVRPDDIPRSWQAHVLLVFDTLDPDLGQALESDRRRIHKAVDDGLLYARRGYKEIPVLQGEAVSPDAVKQAVNGMSVGRDDVVFVYIGGHGTVGASGDHQILLKGKPMPRTDLVTALKAKNPRLVVLVTDTCFGKPATTPRGRAAGRGLMVQTQNIMEDLLFRTKGVVDVNSCAPGEFAWNSERTDGGIMTVNFAEVINGGREQFGKTDELVTWKEVVGAVRERTAAEFLGFRSAYLANPANRSSAEFPVMEKQAAQTVHEFVPLPVAGRGRPAADDRDTVVIRQP